MSPQVKSTTQNKTEESQNCPLCAQKFDLEDFSFLPCTCGYRVCVFCWNGIKCQEGGACPACKSPYEEEPVHFAPPPPTDFKKIREEERAKREEKREQKTIEESRKNLADTRIVKKNLIFVSGLSLDIKDSDDLKKPEYFGKYGEIKSATLLKNNNNEGNKTLGLQRANVEFARIEDAVRSIKAVNSSQEQFGKSIKASLGTTKYCDQFINGLKCTRRVCTYLHEIAARDDCISKEDLNKKLVAYEKSLSAKYCTVAKPVASSNGAKPTSTSDSKVDEQSPDQVRRKGQNKKKSKSSPKSAEKSGNDQAVSGGQGQTNKKVGGGVSKRKQKKGKTDYHLCD